MFGDAASELVRKVKEVAKKQSNKFTKDTKDTLIYGTKSLYEIIHKNNLLLYRNKR